MEDTHANHASSLKICTCMVQKTLASCIVGQARPMCRSSIGHVSARDRGASFRSFAFWSRSARTSWGFPFMAAEHSGDQPKRRFLGSRCFRAETSRASRSMRHHSFQPRMPSSVSFLHPHAPSRGTGLRSTLILRRTCACFESRLSGAESRRKTHLEDNKGNRTTRRGAATRSHLCYGNEDGQKPARQRLEVEPC